MEERWAAVRGARLRYLMGGEGPPLVLVHGMVASSFSFRFNATALARRFQVFIPDLMSGHSSAFGDNRDCSLAGTAQRLREFLDQAGIGNAVILGSSHGGSAVMELAAIAPERFERMILVSPANPYAEHYKRVVKFYLSGVGGVFVRLAPFVPARLWSYGIGRMYAHPDRIVIGTGVGYARPLRIRGAVRYILRSLTTFCDDIEGLRPKLSKIAEIPTLLIWGDRDPVIEIASGYKLQQALGAEMIVMQGVGHLPYEENPEEFNRIMLGLA